MEWKKLTNDTIVKKYLTGELFIHLKAMPKAKAHDKKKYYYKIIRLVVCGSFELPADTMIYVGYTEPRGRWLTRVKILLLNNLFPLLCVFFVGNRNAPLLVRGSYVNCEAYTVYASKPQARKAGAVVNCMFVDNNCQSAFSEDNDSKLLPRRVRESFNNNIL